MPTAISPATSPALPTDPLESFLTTTYSNQKSASVNGAEINVQHMFGQQRLRRAGELHLCALAAEVQRRQRQRPVRHPGAEQFRQPGGYLSRTSNGRCAWRTTGVASSWQSTVDGGNRAAPIYTDAYGQVDVSVGYTLNKNLSFQLEAINLNDSTQRQHGRRNVRP
jgi:outer membrane receptor protein involved in Fe transport